MENSFGIMVAKWRIFRRPIRADIETVKRIMKAVLCLHNYLWLTDNTSYIPNGFVDSDNSDGDIIPGDWRNVIQNDESGLVNLRQVGGNHYGYDVSASRNNFKDYFNSPEGVHKLPI